MPIGPIAYRATCLCEPVGSLWSTYTCVRVAYGCMHLSKSYQYLLFVATKTTNITNLVLIYTFTDHRNVLINI